MIKGVSAGAAILILAGCGLGDTASDGDGVGVAGTSKAGGVVLPANELVHPETSTLCGDKPLRIAFMLGQSDMWGAITNAEMIDEASACPNVETAFFNAKGDQQKAIANLQSVVAQGFDGVLVSTNWPDAQLPGIRAAFEQGVSIAPFNIVIGGEVGKDYTARIDQALDLIGQQHADWIAKQLGEQGKVAYLGGMAGDPWDTGVWNGFKEQIAKYPGIEMLSDAPVPTDWTAESTQKAMAGMLARFPEIDGLVAPYGAGLPGAFRAYTAAGKPLPPIATSSTSNEMACDWLKLRQPDTQMFSVEGTTRGIRIAFRKVLADLTGSVNDESTTYSLFPYIDTTAGVEPKCDPTLPPGADLSSSLTAEDLAKVLE
ncbi:substrate-binding domain-containing protein [Rhodococcus sp. 14C212]|uniref:substrate-binding domain-containing protein n=1 Tax=Rhodococcus sp. 14C212 TaxID=2711209 RepID=UPI0013EE0FFB|nr:substrate-binding domain-containing protein [Rhodococcus sp. 14C212]NGP06741.1 substrate-binding domain-containing protein [Rhodococcus sp. 14C212]